MDPSADWQTVLSQDIDLDELDELLERVAQRDPATAGAALSALCGDVFEAMLILDDPSARERLLGPMGAIVDRSVPATPPDRSIDGLGLVEAAALRSAAGFGGDAGAVLERWLPGALAPDAGLPDRERTTYALASAATGFDDAVLELVGEPPLAFAPGASFGPDARSFARHIVAAVAEEASSNEVSTAWTSFVAFVPARIETGGLGWTDLLFAGTAAYQRVAGFPAGQVLDLIREFVRELAAA
jgi:hypothetical protein